MIKLHVAHVYCPTLINPFQLLITITHTTHTCGRVTIVCRYDCVWQTTNCQSETERWSYAPPPRCVLAGISTINARPCSCVRWRQRVLGSLNTNESGRWNRNTNITLPRFRVIYTSRGGTIICCMFSASRRSESRAAAAVAGTKHSEFLHGRISSVCMYVLVSAQFPSEILPRDG